METKMSEKTSNDSVLHTLEETNLATCFTTKACGLLPIRMAVS